MAGRVPYNRLHDQIKAAGWHHYHQSGGSEDIDVFRKHGKDGHEIHVQGDSWKHLHEGEVKGEGTGHSSAYQHLQSLSSQHSEDETHEAFVKAHPHETHSHGRYYGDELQGEHFHDLVHKHGGTSFDMTRFAIPKKNEEAFHGEAWAMHDRKYRMPKKGGGTSQHAEESAPPSQDASTVAGVGLVAPPVPMLKPKVSQHTEQQPPKPSSFGAGPRY